MCWGIVHMCIKTHVVSNRPSFVVLQWLVPGELLPLPPKIVAHLYTMLSEGIKT